MRNFAFGKKALWLTTAAAIGIVGAFPGQALAQDGATEEADRGGLSEIVVTAQRREENQQDVPISINAVTNETLSNLGVNDTNSLVQTVPSLNFTRSGPTGIFVIRGVSTPNGAAGEEGSTAVYIDDVYMPDLNQTVNKFNNIERIEVLNGPQGTLFGRNATGGAIRIITRDPGDTHRNQRPDRLCQLRDHFGPGLSLDSAWRERRLEHRLHRPGPGQGLRFQLYAGQADQAGRLLVAALQAGGRAQRDDESHAGWGLLQHEQRFRAAAVPGFVHECPSAPRPAAFRPDRSPARIRRPEFASRTRIRAWGLSGKIELDIGFADLTSITSYRKLKNTSAFDVDGRPANLVALEYFAPSSTIQQELPPVLGDDRAAFVAIWRILHA